MEKKARTIKELADLLSMSPTTVSRVLNGQAEKYRISQKTALLVQEKAKTYQFEPNQIARNLRLQKTNTIGLMIPDISNPFFANLARAVEIELRKKDKMILLCDTNDETTLEEKTLSLLLARKVDGLLIAPIGEKWEHLSKDLKVPMVLIDRYFKENTAPYVATNNFEGAYRATSYLIQKGHKQIACIQGLTHTTSNKNRVLGFREASKDHNLPISNISVSGSDYSIENGYTETLKLLQSTQRPTAIFALNNQIAIGVMKALKQSGLKIPEDISLVSFDEQPFFELLSPPLTSIRQPMEEIGKEAVRMLFQIMENKKVTSNLLAPEFIERASVKQLTNP